MSDLKINPRFTPPPISDKTKHVDPRINKQLLDSELKKKELNLKHGLLGRLFGSNENVPHYIIGFVSIIIIITTALYTFFPQDGFSPKDLWVLITPILTSILGYIFGVNSKN